MAKKKNKQKKTKNKMKSFKGNITVEFDGEIKVTNAKIIYIMLEENYLDSVIPVILIALNADNELYNHIIGHAEGGICHLHIDAYDGNNGASGGSRSIDGEYSYKPETTNADYGESLNTLPKKRRFEDTSYRTITVGLVSGEQTAKMRKSFNVIKDSTTSSAMIDMALEGLNVVKKELDNDVEYNIEELGNPALMPPTSTIYRFLENLFNLDAFYNSPFRFFMDTFNTTYLLSQSGGIEGAGDVIVQIVDVLSNEALVDGITSQNGATMIYVPQINVRYSSDLSSREIVNEILAYNDESMEAATYELGNNSEGRTEFSMTNYGNVTQSQYQSDDAAVEIIKNYVDGSIFTPDKNYYINASGNAERMSGQYILIYKRVFWKSVDDTFIITCNLGFKPSCDNNIAHTSSENSTATSKTAKKTTTNTNTNSNTNRSSSSKQMSTGNQRTRSQEVKRQTK